MIGVHVTVPVACYRKGLAREYLETEPIPPPSTCYGFFLSLVGEVDRNRHTGVKVTPMLLSAPNLSVVLRTVWCIKQRNLKTSPDFQQLLTGIELVIWLDSSCEEHKGPLLEERVTTALDPERRGTITRFGGLSLGESTHLVDSVSLLTEDRKNTLESCIAETGNKPRLYQLAERGLLGLPVWVDHVGSTGTRHVVGELVEVDSLTPPELSRMPRIEPLASDIEV